jgi:hypothetical protein
MKSINEWRMEQFLEQNGVDEMALRRLFGAAVTVPAGMISTLKPVILRMAEKYEIPFEEFLPALVGAAASLLSPDALGTSRITTKDIAGVTMGDEGD